MAKKIIILLQPDIVFGLNALAQVEFDIRLPTLFLPVNPTIWQKYVVRTFGMITSVGWNIADFCTICEILEFGKEPQDILSCINASSVWNRSLEDQKTKVRLPSCPPTGGVLSMTCLKTTRPAATDFVSYYQNGLDDIVSVLSKSNKRNGEYLHSHATNRDASTPIFFTLRHGLESYIAPWETAHSLISRCRSIALTWDRTIREVHQVSGETPIIRGHPEVAAMPYTNIHTRSFTVVAKVNDQETVIYLYRQTLPFVQLDLLMKIVLQTYADDVEVISVEELDE
ncbi:unnamed protein product [Orchesella dallaii]|uniref:Uncharacterized protein n=1 Tax=Orchesella dallaii TaxID=48710 RepID=A0ABP1RYG1_9HEXA